LLELVANIDDAIPFFFGGIAKTDPELHALDCKALFDHVGAGLPAGFELVAGTLLPDEAGALRTLTGLLILRLGLEVQPDHQPKQLCHAFRDF